MANAANQLQLATLCQNHIRISMACKILWIPAHSEIKDNYAGGLDPTLSGNKPPLIASVGNYYKSSNEMSRR